MIVARDVNKDRETCDESENGYMKIARTWLDSKRMFAHGRHVRNLLLPLVA